MCFGNSFYDGRSSVALQKNLEFVPCLLGLGIDVIDALDLSGILSTQNQSTSCCRHVENHEIQRLHRS